MKALIVRKVWIDKIFDGGKTWEMRSRPTNVRGKILIIEAGSGHIVGECVITASPRLPIPDREGNPYFDKHKVEDTSLLKKWKYPWVLSDAKRYDKSIPYSHPKGAVIWVNII